MMNYLPRLVTCRKQSNDEALVEYCETGKTTTISNDDIQKANPPKFDKVKVSTLLVINYSLLPQLRFKNLLLLLLTKNN